MRIRHRGSLRLMPSLRSYPSLRQRLLAIDAELAELSEPKAEASEEAATTSPPAAACTSVGAISSRHGARGRWRRFSARMMTQYAPVTRGPRQPRSCNTGPTTRRLGRGCSAVAFHSPTLPLRTPTHATAPLLPARLAGKGRGKGGGDEESIAPCGPLAGILPDARGAFQNTRWSY